MRILNKSLYEIVREQAAGEYYFLNTMEKDGSYDGYAVNATTGQIRQVNDVAHKLLPRYSYDEQNAALFPAEK